MNHSISHPHARAVASPSSWVDSPGFSFVMVAVVVLVALLVGLNIPQHIPLSFVEEDGWVESTTIYLYLAAPFLLFWRLPSLSVTDKLAVTIVLLAFAAREADLHKALFGISILKSRFYNQYASLWQIAVALGVLLPIFSSVAWLALRHGRRFLSLPKHWTPAMTSIASLFVVLVVSKVFDRAPDTLASLHLFGPLPTGLIHLMLSEEEILELSIPAFAMLAMLQGHRAAQRSPKR